MIQNIIIPIPIRIGGGHASPGVVVGVLAGVFALGLVLYIAGFLYDGIKYGDWDFYPSDNMAKGIGAVTMVVVIAMAFIDIIASCVVSLLE